MNIHDDTVDSLANRLCDKHYDDIYVRQEYDSRGNRGEFDVLAIRGVYAHYYEIKSRRTEASYGKALNQFERARNSFPEYVWKFIYVTPKEVTRVRLSEKSAACSRSKRRGSYGRTNRRT